MHPLKSEARRGTGGPGARGPVVALLAIACGVLVANNYLSQTLIAEIGADVGLSSELAGATVTLTQFGSGLGFALVVPLADRFENRRLILLSFVGVILALAAVATATSAGVFLFGCMMLGVCATTSQIMVPMASFFVAPEKQGRVIGLVTAGLLAGIMLARPFASFVTHLADWRAVFWVAMALTVALGLLLLRYLPAREPPRQPEAGELFGSLWTIWRREPLIRRRAIWQALLFLAFNMFWTAAPLELAGRFELGQDGIALFALAGAGGALAAPLAGRVADRGHGGLATAIAIVGVCVMLVATGWVVPAGALAGFWLCALAIDAMVQTNQVVGQRALYQLSESARSRINALYMTVVFGIGAFGPVLGTVLHARFGWQGPAFGGAAFAGAATLLWLAAQCTAAKRTPQ